MKSLSRAGLVLVAATIAFVARDRIYIPTEAHIGTSAFHLELDLDPGNGLGPCAPVDATTAVAEGDTFKVAVCAGDATKTPLDDGSVFAMRVRIGYGPKIVAWNVATDLGLDLSSNPDWNEGPSVGGTDWDCNVAGAPTGQPSPANIFCQTIDTLPNSLPQGSAHLATIEFQAVDTYAAALWFDAETKIWNDFNTMNEFGYAGCNEEAIPVACTGGDVIICDGPPGPNTDNAWGNGPDIPGDDETVPSGDAVPDNCGDTDKDNDGRPDADELTGFLCVGEVTEVSTDVSYSDGDGTSWDTDGDYLSDGLECDNGLDPNSPLSGSGDRAACYSSIGGGDDDGDGLVNSAEVCKWMSSQTEQDSDGDGLTDCEEAADVDGNGYVTPGDGVLIERALFLAGTPELATMDFNANFAVTVADATMIKQAAYGIGQCLITTNQPWSSYSETFEPRLEIDKNPENSGGPCRSIDTARTVVATTSFDVAICLTNAQIAPVNGLLNAVQVEIAYDPAQLSADDVAGNLTTDADSNPDWNESATLTQEAWDCNALNATTSAPRASVSPVRISCRAPSTADAILSGSTTHLFTMHFNALATGPATLTWESGTSEVLSGYQILACNVSLTCIDDPITIVSTTGDVDGDGVINIADNCLTVPNGTQVNSDSGPPPPASRTGFISNGPGIPGEDATIPVGDAFGDACDEDLDNDLRLDFDEVTGTGCGGAITLVVTDVAYSDGDPPTWDTDGDVVPDGVECALGTNPTIGASADRTVCTGGQADGDDDSDGLPNDWETCKWLTSISNTNSDGDALGDCLEVMDVNGNGAVTNADAVFVKQHAFALLIGDLAAMDINGNGALTNADAVFIQQAVFNVPPLDVCF